MMILSCYLLLYYKLDQCNSLRPDGYAVYGGRRAGCKSYLANSLFVFGEFGGNDYNAMIFGGYSIQQARKYTPKIVNTISRGIDVRVEHKLSVFSVS